MSRRLLLEGPSIEGLLERVRDEHGPDATIVRAERVRTGGMAGFFAKERFEVSVEVPEPGDGAAAGAGPGTSPGPAAPADAPPAAPAAPEAPAPEAPAREALPAPAREALPAAPHGEGPAPEGGDLFAALLSAYGAQDSVELGRPQPAAPAGAPAPRPVDAPAPRPGSVSWAGPAAVAGLAALAGPVARGDVHAPGLHAPGSLPGVGGVRRVVRQAPDVQPPAAYPCSDGAAHPGLPDFSEALSAAAAARAGSTGARSAEIRGTAADGGPAAQAPAAQAPAAQAPAVQAPAVQAARGHAGLPVPSAPRGAGEVLVLVGEGAAAYAAAAAQAARMRLPKAQVLLAAPEALVPGLPAPRRIGDAEQAAARGWELVGARHPSVVAVDAPVAAAVDPEVAAWTTAVVEALAPTAVWAVVDATRRTADTARWLAAIGPVDALVVVDAAASCAAAEVLDLGIPLATVDGHPYTPDRFAPAGRGADPADDGPAGAATPPAPGRPAPGRLPEGARARRAVA